MIYKFVKFVRWLEKRLFNIKCQRCLLFYEKYLAMLSKENKQQVPGIKVGIFNCLKELIFSFW